MLFSLRSIFTISISLCTTSTLFAERMDVEVLEDSGNSITLQYDFPNYRMNDILVNGKIFKQPVLQGENFMMKSGFPALPDVSRGIIIPEQGDVTVRIIDMTFHDVEGINIAPSKGTIKRNIDPVSVPWSFANAYKQNAFWPEEIVSARDPHIIRDIRGTVIDVNPFQFNPITKTLRVIDSLTIEVITEGTNGINSIPRAKKHSIGNSYSIMMERHFLNYETATRYDPLSDDGDMLIICYDDFTDEIQPFADHKNSIGMYTTVVPVSSIGNSESAIDAYIENVYNTSNLGFVLLVGDAFQVATGSHPYEGGATDPMYGQIAGTDHYPEIIVGRFSAETGAHVTTQVNRSIDYEVNQATQTSWYHNAIGIASAEGSGIGDDGEADFEHMDVIKQKLHTYGFSQVDQVYDTNGGNSAQITNALHEGRGIINYVGHGSTNAWSTTGFNNSNIDALQNTGMLPWIVSVACVNGEFDGPTCFAEGWLRATHNGEPTGAVLAYMSSVNQYWAEPMCGQDEIVDLFIVEQYKSCGVLAMAGSCQMVDEYGSSGEDMIDTWHIFGDPSLCVVGTTEPADPCDAPIGFCPEDVDGDSVVAVGDVLAVVGNFGDCGDGTYKPIGDVDGDCCVTVSDLLAVVGSWGNDCTPIGACCLPEGGCSEAETESDCLNVGGEYKGDNSSCEFVGCPAPGACCFADGTCVFAMPEQCVDLGGGYQGAGSDCASTQCPIAGAGDECSGPLIAQNGANEFETLTATPSANPPNDAQCAGTYLDWGNSSDIWFLYTATTSGPVHFTTCDGASYDTSMALYEGTCDNQVACNGDGYTDTGCQSYHSEIDYGVVAGNTYYIRIGGWQEATGSGTLTIN
ncbi:MAG: hypothetical protein HOJ00_02030 [Phycisphaerae bacterium]|nr:hypothetical protein [Phycisphaerae bacterium]